ncbi:MAG: hypothetical protein M4579_002590 [Chaenotheca gracillima]|nr:MAG: hypothetical protein M4579_002590 [Chaenotheca gracillima]
MAFDCLSDSSASPLSSLGSVSPAPPDFYPSPSSSQECFSAPQSQETSVVPEPKTSDEGPPTKKRRITAPKPRTTEYLDFSSSSLGDPQSPEDERLQKPQLDKLLKVLRTKRKIVVIAGAGISVSAGVPDFRSSNGLFNTLRERHSLKASGKHLFDASVYRTDASTSSFHDMVRSLSDLVAAARPTDFHHLLASLAKEGRLLRLYTQNVDGIDTSLPPLTTSVPLGTKGPWPQTIQLHGGLGKMVCQKCSTLSDFEASLFDGPEPPACPECEQLDSVRTTIAGKRSHGIGRLRPRIVLYNEHNPDDEAIGAVTKADLRSRPDAVIVVGTTLKVPGVRRIVREMCGVTRARRDGMAIWINNDPEPSGREFEDCWDLVIRGNADKVAHLASLRRWDDEQSDEQEEIGEEAWKKIKEENEEPQVVIETPSKSKSNLLKQAQGVLTPVASPHLKGSQIVQVEIDRKKPSLLERLKASNDSDQNPKPPSKSGKDSKKPRRRPTKKIDKAPKAPSQPSALKRAFKVKKSDVPQKTVSKDMNTQKSLPEVEKVAEDINSLHSAGTPSSRPSDIYIPPSLCFAERSKASPDLERAVQHQDGATFQMPTTPEEKSPLQRESTLSPRGPLPPSLAMLMND